jgi:hypothetical protein
MRITSTVSQVLVLAPLAFGGPAELAVVRLGYTPAVFAGAGVTANELSPALVEIGESPTLSELAQADAAAKTAAEVLAARVDALREDPTNAQLLSDYEAANAAWSQARSDQQEAEGAVRAALFAGLPSQRLAAIQRVEANSANRCAPAFWALSLTQTEFRTLVMAERAEQVAGLRGETVPEWASTLLSQMRANSVVVEASLSIAANEPAIRDLLQP